MKIHRRPVWIALIACFAMLAAPATAQIGSLTCSSNNGKYRYCRADTQNNVRLVRRCPARAAITATAGAMTTAEFGLTAAAGRSSNMDEVEAVAGTPARRWQQAF